MTKATKEPTPAEARKRAGITQEELARKAGVTLRTITRMEASGHWPVWSTTRARVKQALGMAS